MGDKITLTVMPRDLHGKKVIKLRKDGLTPGVVYGPGMEPISIQVADGELSKVVRAAGKHTPIHLTVDAKKKIAMIKDVDFDPIGVGIRHISFHAVRQNKPIVAEVPIHLVGEGESIAERAGLIILQNLDEIEVKALPLDLPEALEIDIRGLKEAGEKVLVSDIKLPENVEIVDNKSGHDDQDDEDSHSILELQVASVWEPGALQAANEASAGGADADAEPEVENGAEGPAEAETKEQSK
ncbi:MAG: 50S ribosomal protein L25 [Candidatus Saccharimonadaceae bacterium]